MTEYAAGDRVKLARGPESRNTWPDDVPDVCYGEYVEYLAYNEVYPHRIRISNGENRVFRDTEVSPAKSIIRVSLRDPENPETLIA